jgi:hypothetical protein
MVGFWAVDVKLLGPAHTWLVPPVDEDVKFMGLPTVTGELLLAVATVGGVQLVDVGFTTTFTVAVAVQAFVIEDDLIVTV